MDDINAMLTVCRILENSASRPMSTPEAEQFLGGGKLKSAARLTLGGPRPAGTLFLAESEAGEVMILRVWHHKTGWGISHLLPPLPSLPVPTVH
jgi:hypothetical protein